MANEISWRGTATGVTDYFTIRRATDRQYWSVSGAAFEALTVANWANYPNAMTETPASSFFFVGSWPAGVSTAGWYWVDVFRQSGGSAAISDALVGSVYGWWNGTKFEPAGGDIDMLGGNAQSATDLKDLADTGYDPATHEINAKMIEESLSLVLSLTTLTTNQLLQATVAKQDLQTASLSTLTSGQALQATVAKQDLHSASLSTLTSGQLLQATVAKQDLHSASLSTLTTNQLLQATVAKQDLHSASLSTLTSGQALQATVAKQDLHGASLSTLTSGQALQATVANQDLHSASLSTLTSGQALQATVAKQDLHSASLSTLTTKMALVAGSDGATLATSQPNYAPAKSTDTMLADVRLTMGKAIMLTGTVDDTGFTPTTTEFEADDITTAEAGHYLGRVILFTSGALLYQACVITGYSKVSGRGHFTVNRGDGVTLTSAPANNVTFVIL